MAKNAQVSQAPADIPPPLPVAPPSYNVIRDQGGWTLLADGVVVHSVDLLGVVLSKLEEHILRTNGLIGGGGR